MDDDIPEKIVDKRIKGGIREYLVKFEGCHEEDKSWEPEDDICKTKKGRQLIEEYENIQSALISTLNRPVYKPGPKSKKGVKRKASVATEVEKDRSKSRSKYNDDEEFLPTTTVISSPMQTTTSKSSSRVSLSKISAVPSNYDAEKPKVVRRRVQAKGMADVSDSSSDDDIQIIKEVSSKAHIALSSSVVSLLDSDRSRSSNRFIRSLIADDVQEDSLNSSSNTNGTTLPQKSTAIDQETSPLLELLSRNAYELREPSSSSDTQDSGHVEAPSSPFKTMTSDLEIISDDSNFDAVVSAVKKVKPKKQQEPMEEEDQNIVEEILKRKTKKKTKKIQYKVKWKGYSEEDSTWIDFDQLDHNALDLVKAFEKKMPKSSRIDINKLMDDEVTMEVIFFVPLTEKQRHEKRMRNVAEIPETFANPNTATFQDREYKDPDEVDFDAIDFSDESHMNRKQDIFGVKESKVRGILQDSLGQKFVVVWLPDRMTPVEIPFEFFRKKWPDVLIKHLEKRAAAFTRKAYFGKRKTDELGNVMPIPIVGQIPGM